MILRNYNNIDFVLNIEIDDFFFLYLKLLDKNLEEKVWEIWLSKFPTMTEKSYISYDEMLNIAKQKEVKNNIPKNGVYVDQVFF